MLYLPASNEETVKGKGSFPYIVGTSNGRLALFNRKLNDTARIILSVALLDLKTRHGRSYLGYLVAIAWPLSHLVFVFLGYIFTTRIAPVGDNPAIFAATGLLPYISCLYPSRLMAFSVLQNKHLLNIPIVRPIHLVAGRFIIEILTAVIVCAIFTFGLYVANIDFVPINIYTAISAVAASIYLGIGFGFVIMVLCSLYGPMVFTFYLGILILAYIFSGVYIPYWLIGEPIKSYLTYNPLFNLVEWLRSAYYTSYDETHVNKFLVLGTASVCLLIGLLGEKYFRGKVIT